MYNKDIEFDDKPYERFIKFGPSSLNEAELLAIILRTGTKDLDAKQLAIKVMELGANRNSGLLGLYDLSLDELMSIKGIGQVKAIKLKAITELSMRLHRAVAKEGFTVSNPSSVADYYMEELRHLDKEVVMLACLDSKARLTSSIRISEGIVNRSLVSPRNIFLEALSKKAVFIILIHNHPSGDPSPSSEDISLTQSIIEAGNLIDIRLLDHIIIGNNKYYSFKENNYI